MKKRSHPSCGIPPWNLMQSMTELWWNVPMVIALRSQQWWLSDPKAKRQVRENQRMVTEKLDAMIEIGFAWQRSILSFWLGNFDPWRSSTQMLRPWQRRVTANARRLQGKSERSC